ncbi:hypothetical protein [Pseudomonas oryzihabitans]|uniref:hypothetical protein n=1 Tax=Pseudomonas oryzihabitans TaxID=47885 RepID=UPI00142EE021|nr:hypothetical protein [Pseudomonas psychrotolerans]
MDIAAGVSQGWAESFYGNEWCWLQVSLARTQLLSVRHAQEIQARVVTGWHWISSADGDVAISSGEQVKLPAGLVLIEGEGVLQFAPATTHDTQAFTWRLSPLFRRRAKALEIAIKPRRVMDETDWHAGFTLCAPSGDFPGSAGR